MLRTAGSGSANRRHLPVARQGVHSGQVSHRTLPTPTTGSSATFANGMTSDSMNATIRPARATPLSLIGSSAGWVVRLMAAQPDHDRDDGERDHNGRDQSGLSGIAEPTRQMDGGRSAIAASAEGRPERPQSGG
jgi:protein involved in temperature-dependent protein secretion